MPKLRYYQREAADAVEWGWEEHNRQVVKLSTGSGKTVVFSELVGRMQPGRCLVVADQQELVRQPVRTIQKWTGIIAGIHQASDRPGLGAQVVVGSAQTLAREKGKGSGNYPHLEYYPRDHFDYIISDECHRNVGLDERVWNYFDKAKVLGVTATPFRSGLADLSKWFSNVAYSMDIIDMVEQGFAPRPNILKMPVEINLENIAISRGLEGRDYNLEDLDTTIAPYYEAIGEIVRDTSKGRHGIAFLPLVKSSESFAAILRSMGVRAMHVDGGMTDRAAIIHAFERGEIDWLCNAGVLSTGVDLPIADAFLNLRLTQSRSWYQQARGRAFRVLPGLIDHLTEKDQAEERKSIIAASAKPDALIYDFLLQHDRLGVVNPFEDFCRNEDDARTLAETVKGMRDPADAIVIAQKVLEEREAAIVAALERAAIRSAINTPLTPEQVGALVGCKALIDFVPVQRWEQEPPTPPQLSVLQEMGVDIKKVASKGQASKIMEELHTRRQLGYATLKQVKLIKQIEDLKSPEERIRNIETMTLQEANRFINEAFHARRRAVA